MGNAIMPVLLVILRNISICRGLWHIWGNLMTCIWSIASYYASMDYSRGNASSRALPFIKRSARYLLFFLAPNYHIISDFGCVP